MSRLAKILFSLLAIAAVAGLVLRAQRFFQRDPFAYYKHPDPSDIGVQLNDVQVKAYSGSRLTGDFHVKTVNVRQDHQFLDMLGITKGVVQTKSGPLNFVAPAANYDAITKQLNVTKPTHVQGKDMNVLTPSFLYDANTSTLRMPGQVKGTLSGGTFQANNLIYHADAKNPKLKGGPIIWQGDPSKSGLSEVSQVTQGGNSKTSWTFSCEEMQSTADSDIWLNAQASDGEILVKAPKVIRDKKTDVLTTVGKTYYFSEKVNAICDKAVIYRKEKRAVLTGNVHMLMKPKDQEKLNVEEIPPYNPPVPADIASKRPAAPDTAESQQEKDLDDELRDSKTMRKYPAHIKSDKIEYWYAKGNRHALITGSPQAYQELPGNRWRRVATDNAVYNGETDMLRMNSSSGQDDTRLVDSLGDDMVAKWLEVSTKEGEEDLLHANGPHGHMVTNEEDVPTGKGNSNTQTPPPANAGTTGGGSPPKTTGSTGGG